MPRLKNLNAFLLDKYKIEGLVIGLGNYQVNFNYKTINYARLDIDAIVFHHQRAQCDRGVGVAGVAEIAHGTRVNAAPRRSSSSSDASSGGSAGNWMPRAAKTSPASSKVSSAAEKPA